MAQKYHWKYMSIVWIMFSRKWNLFLLLSQSISWNYIASCVLSNNLNVPAVWNKNVIKAQSIKLNNRNRHGKMVWWVWFCKSCIIFDSILTAVRCRAASASSFYVNVWSLPVYGRFSRYSLISFIMQIPGYYMGICSPYLLSMLPSSVIIWWSTARSSNRLTLDSSVCIGSVTIN